MTNLTPTQEETLNRAIAEFDQWQTPESANYTRSLDAIVPVVQMWLWDKENPVVSAEQMFQDMGCMWPFLPKTNPALALCLAFAQAAGIKWEGSDGNY